MVVALRREPSPFWRRARRHPPLAPQPLGPPLPPGTIVRVPGRGDVFVRYQAGPPGAPTVLLVHGWMASADLNWLGAFPALADRYHVVAMDVRGHGRGIRSSEPFSLEDCADDAAALLRELGVPAVVAGYSMGGAIALLLARRHPEVARGLVMVASAAELARTGLGRGAHLGVPLLGLLLRAGLPDRVARELARHRPLALGALAQSAPWLAGELKRLHPADVVAAGRAVASFDARDWAGELGLPAASVVTLRDRAVPAAKQRATAMALDGHVVELDGGHGVCATEPEALGAALRGAVDLVDEARRRRRHLRLASARWTTRRDGRRRPIAARSAERQAPDRDRIVEPLEQAAAGGLEPG
jgi:pimeloyl-ACP methyl ester carboxylesterase